MKTFIRNQKHGLIALGILVVGFLGLIFPIAFHWNRWILAFVFVRKSIVVPLILCALGLGLDRQRYAAALGILLCIALYLAPRFLLFRSQ